MNLPPVVVPFIADLSRMVSGLAQAQRLAQQAQPIKIPVEIQMESANRGIADLTNQMRALRQAVNDSAASSGAYRTNIAQMTAENVRLRQEIAQTVQGLRAKGVALKDTAQFTQQLRAQLQANTQAMAQERVALAQSTEQTRQYRTALATVRQELAAAEKAYKSLAQAAAQAAREQQAQSKASKDGGTGGFLGGLASRSLGSSLNYGVAFGAGAAVGSAIFKTLTTTIGAATDAIIGFNASLEQSRVAFTTFLGSSERADAFLKQLQAFAVKTPFEFPDLVEASKRMLAFGFAAQQVIPLLTAVGNQASAVGLGADGVNRITLALGQMQAKGHVSGEELRQLSEAGVQLDPIFKSIADQLQITTAQARKLGEDGSLSAQIFIQAFQKVSENKFGDLMEKQSQTFNGAMSNIKDALTIVVAQIGGPLFKAISDAAIRFANFLQTPQFAIWAKQAQMAIGAVISYLGSLLTIIGRVVQGLTGWKMPELTDAQKQAFADSQTQAVESQQQISSAIADTTADLVKASGQQESINKQLVAQRGLIDANKDAQEAQNEKIQDTAAAYDTVIQGLERQLQDIQRLRPEDIANKISQAKIDQQIIEVKIGIPDTTELEHTLRALQRAKEDLGTFDASPWDVPLQKLRDQIDEISNRDTKDLDEAIRKVQEDIRVIGERTSEDLDNQIAQLRKNIDSLSDAGIKAAEKQIAGIRDQIDSLNTDDLDRRIEDIRAKLNQPDTDFTGISGQLAAQAALIQAGGGAAANAAFAGLSRQKQAMVDASRQNQVGLKAQLAALEAERTAQARYNEDTKKALEGQIKLFEAQKQALQDSNDAQKAGWEDQIKALEEIKRQREITQRADKNAAEATLRGLEEQKRLRDAQNQADRSAAESQVRELEKQKKAAQETFQAREQALAKQIEATQRLIQDAKQPAEDEIERLTRQKQMLDLEQQRRDIDREILTIPLKQKIEDEKRAKEDALKPLQDELEAQQRIGKELDSKLRKLEQDRAANLQYVQDLQDKLANLGGAGPGAGGPTIPKPPEIPVEETPFQKWIEGLKKDLPEIERDLMAIGNDLKNFFSDPTVKGLLDFKTNLDNITESINAVKNTFSFFRAVYEGDWEGLRKLTGEKAAQTIEVYDEFGNHIGQYTTQAHKSWLTDWGAFWKMLHDSSGLSATQWEKDIFGPGGIIGKSFDDMGATFEKLGTLTNKWFGRPDGNLAKAVKEFDDEVADLFGDGGKIGQKFSAFGTWMQQNVVDKFKQWFGVGGDIAGFFSEFGTTVNDWFGEGQKIGTAFSQFGTWMQENVVDKFKQWFGTGGDIGTFFSEFGSAVNDWFGEGQKIGTAFSKFGTFMNGIFGPDGSLAHLFGGLGEIVSNALGAVSTPMNNFLTGIGNAIHAIGDFFHISQLKEMPIPHIDFGAKLAGGDLDWKGGPAVIGEAGRELYRAGGAGSWQVASKPTFFHHLPEGSTVLPNAVTERILAAGVPGFAFGLGDIGGAIGGFFSGVVQKVEDLAGESLSIARRGGQAVYDKTVGNLVPELSLPMLPGLDSILMDAGKNGLHALIDEALKKVGNLIEKITGGAGGNALFQLADLIRAAGKKYNIPPEIIGAIILHESGGVIGRVEVGGGKGRGLMQVDGGTWPQAYDPRMVGTSMADADYQIDIGSMILGKAFGAANGNLEQALTNYAGSGFAGVHGRTFYKELQDMGLIAAALAALNEGGIIPGGTGFIRPVRGPITQEFGQTGFYLEPGGFHDGVDFGVGTGTPVHADAAGQVTVAGWDNGWGIRVLIDHLNGIQTWMAHNQEALVRVGDRVLQGQVIASSDNTGQSTGPHVHWGAHVNGRPFDPLQLPGLASGGYITSPMLAVVGEGPEPEIISPDSKLRQIVREESGGVSVHFEDGAISVDANGRARVDASKIVVNRTLTRSAQAKGILTGVGG